MGSEVNKKGAKGFTVAALTGGWARLTAQVAIAPLDRTKILLQAQNPMYRHLGVIATAQKIYTQEGALAFFRGNGTQMVRHFFYGAIQFSTYDQCTVLLPQLGVSPGATKFFSGYAAGLSAVALTFPLDLVRARLAFQTTTKRYSGIADALRKIMKEEGGVRALFRGTTPSLIATPLHNGVMFYLYDHLKEMSSDYVTHDWSHLAMRDVACGSVAGSMAVCATNPFDVTRRRMQLAKLTPETEKFSHGFLTAVGHVYKDDGIARGLYRGLSLNLVRGGVKWGITLPMFDQLTNLYARSKKDT